MGEHQLLALGYLAQLVADLLLGLGRHRSTDHHDVGHEGYDLTGPDYLRRDPHKVDQAITVKVPGQAPAQKGPVLDDQHAHLRKRKRPPRGEPGSRGVTTGCQFGVTSRSSGGRRAFSIEARSRSSCPAERSRRMTR